MAKLIVAIEQLSDQEQEALTKKLLKGQSKGS
ncbi:hypothetical protein FHY15_000144 [Xanthomonas arboricola]|nr:hypothetical protein [Xanthomonas arboricola]